MMAALADLDGAHFEWEDGGDAFVVYGNGGELRVLENLATGTCIYTRRMPGGDRLRRRGEHEASWRQRNGHVLAASVNEQFIAPHVCGVRVQANPDIFMVAKWNQNAHICMAPIYPAPSLASSLCP
ncbi:hypothetical protein EXIGLDRAFT_776346 [Exidia glandulosa HHB12029]|uniref:Uncharacterized protein n=1 Tax=Exidia glandulosa HHB12029 TaxID=1314781 RepID=A0A165ZP98_EXIGL|nr:hypothetical protein EXIGLDRAFT_776346 [Exidia glandulosa HHB12029]